VVSDLPATIYLYDGDIVSTKQVLGFSCLALRESGRMLQQPDFVARIGFAIGGEVLHGFPRWNVCDGT
jgi:hypothetical protein